jgi:hypothetical protein
VENLIKDADADADAEGVEERDAYLLRSTAKRNHHPLGLMKMFKARVKARHETFNARLKGFAVLATSFRHGYENHKRSFLGVCVALQYDLESGHGLFEV